MATTPTFRRRIAGTAAGNLIEAYDFFVYAFSAPVLAMHFFPKSNEVAALLGTFAIFAVAYVARPLGGVFFGYLGDRIGRIKVFSLTVILVGAGTALIGLLPTYAVLGVGAPIALLLCRLLQGFAVGGQTTGAFSYIVESVPTDQRARWVSLCYAVALLGNPIVVLVVLLAHTVAGEQAYAAWVWRVPFLVGGLLSGIGIWLRVRLTDSEEFTAATRQGPVKNPLRLVVKTSFKSIVILTVLGPTAGVSIYLLVGYMFTYLEKFAHLSATVALLLLAATLIVTLIVLPLAGAVAEQIGRKPVMLSGSILLLAVSYPAFTLVASGTLLAAFAGLILLGLGVAVFNAGFLVTGLELFPTATRYTGNALSYTLGVGLAGGVTPLICTALISSSGSPMAPAFFLMAVVVVGLVALAFTPETKGIELRTSVGGLADTEVAPVTVKIEKDPLDV
jgi:MHS family proline/betaine transporter-like MFS transporter